jgi:thiol-disulfide isomerase/thioredoxin
MTRKLVLVAMLLAVSWPASATEPPQNFAVQEPRVAVPEIHFEDDAGRPRTLADFSGKVILLNIWATWCLPCREEMPTLDRLQAKLGGPDFEVVALSMDRGGPDKVKKFFAEIGIEHLALNIDTSARRARSRLVWLRIARSDLLVRPACQRRSPSFSKSSQPRKLDCEFSSGP